MNLKNAIAEMSIVEINKGLYVRLPAQAVRITGYKKGDKVSVYVPRDGSSIKLVKRIGERDIIQIPDPDPVREQEPEQIQQVPEPQPDPGAMNRLSVVLQAFGLKK